jgi:DNA primase
MVHIISKEQLVLFYSSHWEDLKPYILNHYLTGFNAHGIYVRLDKEKNPVEVRTKAEFLAFVQQKYLTQLIPELPFIDHEDETNELVIDMDSPFTLAQNKNYINDCWIFAERYIPAELIKKIIAVATGGKSFHLRIQINDFMEWEPAKEYLAEKVIAPFYDKYGDDLTYPESVRMPSKASKQTHVHLDMSSMKKRGCLRCPYSFYKDTPQFAMPLESRSELKDFTIEQATVFVANMPTETTPLYVRGSRAKKTTAAKATRKATKQSKPKPTQIKVTQMDINILKYLRNKDYGFKNEILENIVNSESYNFNNLIDLNAIGSNQANDGRVIYYITDYGLHILELLHL